MTERTEVAALNVLAASKPTEEKEETEVNELACPNTSSIASTQDNVPGDGKRLVAQKTKDHGYREYLTLRRQMKRAFFDAAGDDDRANILNQFFDRFLFVEKDGCTPLSTTEARNKIIQDLYETKTFSPPKSKPLVTENNQATTSAKVAAAAAAAAGGGMDDDPSHEENATKEDPFSKKKLSSWKAWDHDKIVVQYGKYARKNTKYIRFRAEWTDKYQAGSREQRNRIVEDALKRFTFVREDDGNELPYDSAWRKVEQDLGRNLVLPSRYFHDSKKQHRAGKDDEDTNMHKLATSSHTDTFSHGKVEAFHDKTVAIGTASPPLEEPVGEKSVVFLGRSARNNEEYLRLRIEWKPKYRAASVEERARIVEDFIRRFIFQHEDGTKLAPEAARKKVTKDFFTELRSPDKPNPRRHDSYKSRSKGREQQGASGKKSIVQLGESAPKSNLYWRLTAEWKPKYRIGKSEERQRIVDHILNRFTFVKDGVELSLGDASKKVVGDLNDQESLDEAKPACSLRKSRPRSASNDSKSYEAGNVKQSKKSMATDPPSKDHSDEDFMESENGKERDSTCSSKSIVQLGEGAPNNNLYSRLTAEWKPNFKVGKPEERKRIVEEFPTRFSFENDGVELRQGDGSEKNFGDLNDQESLDEEQLSSSLGKSSPRTAANNSKSYEAENVKNAKELDSLEREESEKLVVYGGASRGEGNMAYIERLKERKWDYINAETEEDAEKVVDSILESFTFHNYTPEAARKKVSQGLQGIGERIAKADFRWCAHSDTGERIVEVQRRSLRPRNPKTSHGASSPRTISRNMKRVGKAITSSSSRKRDAFMVTPASMKCRVTKRVRANDEATDGTNKRMTTRSHDTQKATKRFASHDEVPESDVESDQAEEGNISTEKIQETLSDALPTLVTQLAQLNEKCHSILQSQQYLDAAKLFHELGDSENAKQMMNQYLNSLK
jgi:hypothetical protein